MKITVLGSGTSQGVPMIGCDCRVCRSSNPKNKRNRPCLYITTDEGFCILVDTPPELRLACIANDIRRVDAVIFTHSHADHLVGLDDLRTFNWLQQSQIPLYAEANVLADIQRMFAYVWKQTQAGGGKPQLILNEIEAGTRFTLGNMAIDPMRVVHGELSILAYLFGERAAYVTDVSAIPDDTFSELKNRPVLLLDAVRRKPHPTHFHLSRALEVAKELNCGQTYFVHLSHDYDHDEVNAELPKSVKLAYDGLVIAA